MNRVHVHVSADDLDIGMLDRPAFRQRVAEIAK